MLFSLLFLIVPAFTQNANWDTRSSLLKVQNHFLKADMPPSTPAPNQLSTNRKKTRISVSDHSQHVRGPQQTTGLSGGTAILDTFPINTALDVSTTELSITELVIGKYNSRKKREAWFTIDCDAIGSLEVLRVCAIDKGKELIKDEEQNIILTNITAATLFEELNIEVQILSNISSILKSLNAPKAFMQQLDNNIIILANFSKKSHELFSSLNLLFDDLKKSDNAFYSNAFYVTNSVLTIPSFLLALTSVVIHCIIFFKCLRCTFSQNEATNSIRPPPPPIVMQSDPGSIVLSANYRDRHQS